MEPFTHWSVGSIISTNNGAQRIVDANDDRLAVMYILCVCNEKIFDIFYSSGKLFYVQIYISLDSFVPSSLLYTFI